MLAKFSSEDAWSKVIESSFTKLLDQACSLQVECGQVGESPETMELAVTWAEGLTAAKGFVKLHREFVKTNHKRSRLQDLAESLTKAATA